MLTFTKFMIDDCFHCNRIEGTYDSLSKKLTQHIFYSNNVSKDKFLEDMYQLKVYPTIICKNNGYIVGRIEGIISPEKLKSFVQEMVGKYGE